jgi:hypothetical protein
VDGEADRPVQRGVRGLHLITRGPDHPARELPPNTGILQRIRLEGKTLPSLDLCRSWHILPPDGRGGQAAGLAAWRD